MRVVVPHQRGHALAFFQPHGLQTFRQPQSALVQLSPGGAMHGPVRQPRNNFHVRGVPPRPLQQRRERERIIHHRVDGIG